MPVTTLNAIREPVREAIANAIRGIKKAQREAYDDTRTNSTVCTDSLDSAAASLESARLWFADYLKETRRDEKRRFPAPPSAKSEIEEAQDCGICGAEIAPGDLARCGGCDRAICPDCIEDNGICHECEAEEE